ncbi:hypothetical protein SPRG_11474 [Saprolegnia parasitica CBS 223.65]|uniref:MARVEL domain-containing protein n=1 Tax=Saprolegnia parasitica (strain CBS 223.65) TaxID=695850 RepID=A0A067C986_SAPPC|nr:hypothetical protein SPRG_11474 [Saprolegnia parasitica CBS 223.65]KDO23382.1 hypothetical protein SPRG_11474 [Saprolegnia parasitica CBS 223.65]|eukprot:XP_012205872.1 hypothetical protein SPRG_11474 [Saprolegnia parasitica CBS 223.65]
MATACAAALDSTLSSLSNFPGFSSCNFLSALARNNVDLSLVASDCGSVICSTFLATSFWSSRFSNCDLSDGVNTIPVSTLRTICFYPSKQDALTRAPTTKPPKTTTPPPTTTLTPTTTPPVTAIATRSPIDDASRGNQTTLTSAASSTGTTGMTVGLILIGLGLLLLLCLFVMARKRAHRQKPQAPIAHHPPPVQAHHDDDDDDDDDIDWSDEVLRFVPFFGRVLQTVCAGIGLAALSGAFPTVTTVDGVSTQLGGGVWTALLVVLVLLLLQGAALVVLVYKDIASRPLQECEDDDDASVHYVPLTTIMKATVVVDVLFSLAGLVVGLSTAASDLNASCGSVDGGLLRCGPLRTAIAFDLLTLLVMWTLLGLWVARMDPDERRFHAGWPVSPSEASHRVPPEPYAAHAT